MVNMSGELREVGASHKDPALIKSLTRSMATFIINSAQEKTENAHSNGRGAYECLSLQEI